MSVFVPVLYYFSYHNFVMEFEIKESDSSNSIFLFQDCSGYSGSCVLLYKLQTFFSSNSVKNAISNLRGIALSVDCLG